MKSLSLLSSGCLKAGALSFLIAAWLAIGCGNNGGSGDGVFDDSLPPGGASSAGRSSGRAGAANSRAGSSAHGGAMGSAGHSAAGGASGAAGAGGSGGAPGSAGHAAASGSVAASGSAGTTSATGGTAGKGAGGSSAGSGSLSCGNGIIEKSEPCDDSSLQSAGGGGSGGGGGTGGGGGGGDGPSDGGAPSVKPKYGETCSNTCFLVGNQECLDCEAGGDCSESMDNCLGVDMPFDAGQQTACYAVMTCIQKSNCFDGSNTLGKCYCGSLNTTDCGAAPFSGAGAADGPCVEQIKAGFPNYTKNSQVLAGLVSSTTFPSGAAMKRLSCQKGAEESKCSKACGFTSGGPAFP